MMSVGDLDGMIPKGLGAQSVGSAVIELEWMKREYGKSRMEGRLVGSDLRLDTTPDEAWHTTEVIRIQTRNTTGSASSPPTTAHLSAGSGRDILQASLHGFVLLIFFVF
jgi:hypothetical protein